MDQASQLLYDHVAWQWPIKGIVTLAFYAFAFKLVVGIFKHLLRSGCRLKRWAVNADAERGAVSPQWEYPDWLDARARHRHALNPNKPGTYWVGHGEYKNYNTFLCLLCERTKDGLELFRSWLEESQ